MKQLTNFGIKTDLSNSLWEKYIDWLNSNYYGNIKGNILDYYGLINSKIEGYDSDRFEQIITLEQWKEMFINSQINTMEEYVIKSLTPEHGAEIIKHFKSKNFDTNNFTGILCESNGNYCIYFGVINNNFNCYSLEYVKQNNIKIIQLPKQKTINQIKELNMEKEIIGYKLIKPEYLNVCTRIMTKDFLSNTVPQLFINNNNEFKAIKDLQLSGVLDLWFTPIYKSEEKVYTLGITETFEIIVKDKKAFYGSEDVTETLISFQNTFSYLPGLHDVGKYTWKIGETTINGVGCIKNNSYLSQWLAIDLN